MRADKIQNQPVKTRWRLRQLEINDKGVGSVSGPGIRRPRQNVRPVFCRVTLPDHEIDVIGKPFCIGGVVPGDGELTVIAVRRADLKNHGKGGAAGKARQYPPAQQTSLQDSFHRFIRLEVWIKPIYPNIGRNGGTTPTLFPWADAGGEALLPLPILTGPPF